MLRIPTPILSLVLVLTVGAAPPAAELHVAPDGDDSGPGSAARPLRSLAAAQRSARALITAAEPVRVLLHRGTFYLPETLVFTADDSGREGAPVTWAAAPGEEVVISGGVRLLLSWRPWRDGIMQATVPAGLAIDQLFVDGQRQPMARYPNFDPAVAHFNGSAADAFSPARAARWADPSGGFIHAMHKAEWGDYHYLITGKDADNHVTYVGGWQNNRQMGMHTQYRMVENIFEELDAPGEWYLDAKAATLYAMPPPGVDLAKAVIEGVRLRHLVELRGDQRRPVRFLTLSGLVFRHAARTFMDNKEPLLRSDWTTYRGGALFLTGTEDCTISGCTIDQVGGNAVFVSGYNRRVVVSGCDIDRAGANGVAFVGEARAVRDPLFEYGQRQKYGDIDRTPGPRTDDYPADCTVDDCLIHATGRVEKQTAPVEIDLAMRITVRDCSIYAVPRAGINIGDGCWGGHLVEGCDVFDTVLETGDHGSFNSWGRDRWWELGGVDPNTVTLGELKGLPLLDVVEPITLRHNRWRCDHGWDIDLDDGSSNYRIVDNLCLHGGIKLREGFYRVVENNVMVDNSFHPHVWYKDSQDIVRHNIVFGVYRPIGVPTPWGKECDANLLHVPGAGGVPATRLQEQSGRDGASLAGDARFIAPALGDYRVASGSPALALGFVNFPTDHYGVRSPRLRALARQPVLPGQPSSATTEAHRDAAELPWLGARIKNLSSLGEVSATGMPGETGVMVVDPGAGGLAAAAGVRALDVICRLDGKPVETVQDVLRAYAATAPDAPVTLGLWRAQHEVTATIAGGRGLLLSPRIARFGEGRRPNFDADKDFLGGWTDEHVGLGWDLNATPAGTYDVAILVASPVSDAGAAYQVTLGSQRLTGVVPATGGWESFTARAVGTLIVDRSGPLVVELDPSSKPAGAVMNLRALVLTRR